MKILVLHLIMCNNGLKTFYPLVVMKITFFCYLLLITKSGFKTGNNWRTNMNPKRKIILSCILITLINITSHLYIRLLLSAKQQIPFNLQLRLLSAAFFYFFQLYLLYHVAKSFSKAIYFFPFHWMIELWRNLACVGFCSVAQPPMLYNISSLFWASDWFPCTYTPYILIPHSPIPLHLTLEVIIKICICVIAILFSIQTILQRNAKRNCFETAV